MFDTLFFDTFHATKKMKQKNDEENEIKVQNCSFNYFALGQCQLTSEAKRPQGFLSTRDEQSGITKRSRNLPTQLCS